MAAKRKDFFCCYCNSLQPFRKRRVDHLLHGVISLLTLGLWGTVWIVLLIRRVFRPWLCCTCGRKRLPRSVLRATAEDRGSRS